MAKLQVLETAHIKSISHVRSSNGVPRNSGFYFIKEQNPARYISGKEYQVMALWK
jgi:hypothetical protein